MIVSFHSKRTRLFLTVGILLVLSVVGVFLLQIPQAIHSAATGSGVSQRKVIVLDPGHGGMDGGAVGVDGVIEKDINLSIALKLRTMLQANGYRVIMTREEDISTGDEDAPTVREKKRTDILNRMKLLEETENAYFISVHQNQFTQPQYSGAQMFYGPNDPSSERLAQILQANFKACIQPQNEREIKEATNQVYLIYNAKVPAVLVECGFLSNPEESQRLQQDGYQNQVAFTILLSLLQFDAN